MLRRKSSFMNTFCSANVLYINKQKNYFVFRPMAFRTLVIVTSKRFADAMVTYKALTSE